MSKKHLYRSSDGLVTKSLRGLVASNPTLCLIPSEKVVYDTQHSPQTVSIVSGGGGGHEPAWGGYVGRNMLASSASGDIFASPSTKQIMSAIEAVPSDKGTILVIANYTGDCLHFGLACEKANANNKSPCGTIICGDDVSVGKKGGLVGRRGLAGQLLVCKLLGAASAAGASFEECMKLGTAAREELVSIAATLDHCHVPGRIEHAALEEDEVEMGTGPHNEPGYRKICPAPNAEDYVSEILNYLLDPNDTNRAYVPFSPTDSVVLQVCNYGGVSPLELNAMVDELLNQLSTNYSIQPLRVFVAVFESSLNAPAFSVTLFNMTRASTAANTSLDKLTEYIDMETATVWEAAVGGQRGTKRRDRKEQFVERIPKERKEIDSKEDLKVEPTLLQSMIRTACNRIIACEPNLTKWDTIMGDGDCGETLKTGATAILGAIMDGNITSTGSVLTVLQELESIIESKMGGTLGGILGIFLVSLSSAVQSYASIGENSIEVWSKGVEQALGNLQRYTPAKIGDRTVLDVLIPFAKSLKETGKFQAAVEEAEKGAENTKAMKPKLGRATYVGEIDVKEMPPDPGAWGAMEVIKGLYEGMSGIEVNGN